MKYCLYKKKKKQSIKQSIIPISEYCTPKCSKKKKKKKYITLSEQFMNPIQKSCRNNRDKIGSLSIPLQDHSLSYQTERTK